VRLHAHEWGDAGAPPVVCLHGVSAHGRRFRRLAEERLASRFRVVAPDLRGHGRSEWEPPWTTATHLADLVETLDALGVRRAAFVGHSYGGRLALELAAHDPDRIERLVLLDPAIQLLPHVAYDQAEGHRADRIYSSPDEAIAERLEASSATPRFDLEEEMREHLVEQRDGSFRFRYCQGTVVSLYAELATTPPPPETVRAPTVLVHAHVFGLVRDDQISDYRAALGDRLSVLAVHGGHIVYWDAWAETAAAVDGFLA
jgi:lipase